VKIRFIPAIFNILFITIPLQTQAVFPQNFSGDYQFEVNRGKSSLSLANNYTQSIIRSGVGYVRNQNFYARIKSSGPNLPAQNEDSAGKIQSVDYTRLALVCGGLVGTMTAVHIYQQNGWWKDNRAPFHFKEDLIYGLSVDKIGHFYGADLIAFLVRKSLLWANLSDEQALWYGAGGGLLVQTFTEVEDGFSAWGFDRVDWLSDLGGAFWAPAQYYVPPLRSVNMKMSYHPSDLLGNPGGIGFKGQKHIIIDDYEGQTFWLSFKIEDILPGSLRRIWPDFLCIAVGYAARGVATPNPYPVYFIAPDIDFVRLIPQTTPLLKTISEALNYIHPPLPAIRISPTVIMYGIYF
jgi:hypothetical protein